jgi:hypothetical protein
MFLHEFEKNKTKYIALGAMKQEGKPKNVKTFVFLLKTAELMH